MNASEKLLQRFSASLEREGRSVEDELVFVREIRQKLQGVDRVPANDSRKNIGIFCTVLPRSQSKILQNIALTSGPGKRTLRHVLDVMEDMARGAEEVLCAVQEGLKPDVAESNGVADEFAAALVKQNIFRWMLLRNLEARQEQVEELLRENT